MSNLITQQNSAIESALITGDLSKLNTDQRLYYYNSVCDSLGLNRLTKPFDYIQLNGKLTLYAKRDATDQLRKINGVSIKITAREKIEDIYIVTAQGTDKHGRYDESTGAVNVAGLKGENLANAFLKAETKAKRRVTLSLCGLGLLDETEVQSIPDAKPFVESISQQNVAAIAEVMAEVKSEQKPNNPFFDMPKTEAGSYVIKFGKYKDQSFDQLGEDALSGYIKYLLDSVQKNNKPLSGNALELVERGQEYLDAMINAEGPSLDTGEEIPF